MLRQLLERGDASYRVEANAAEALGRTRREGNVDFLLTLLTERRTWMNIVERGICTGLGESGEDRVVAAIASYLNTSSHALMLRHSAVTGLLAVGRNRSLYSEGARQRAVNALSAAVEHDTWEPVRSLAAKALASLGEKSAIAVLEQSASRELSSGAQRSMRVAAYKLSTDEKNDEQFKQLRNDLDEVREANRKLKEQLGMLEARIP